MIPKILKRENATYKFIKEYDNYVLYENTNINKKECFNKQDLGLIENSKIKGKHII
jgi:hypothetical protein